MSSELQLDVRLVNRWRRHLVNAYETRQKVMATCRLTAWTRGSAAGPTLGNEYGRILPLPQ